jgi:DNA-binding YbaB/EbfC family protein
MNQAQMLAQVKKMQAQMEKAQEEIASAVVVGTAGGNAISVEMTGDYKAKSVKIAAEAVDPADVETLEDLLVAAINDATAKAQELSNKRMGAVTGGLRIPGM